MGIIIPSPNLAPANRALPGTQASLHGNLNSDSQHALLANKALHRTFRNPAWELPFPFTTWPPGQRSQKQNLQKPSLCIICKHIFVLCFVFRLCSCRRALLATSQKVNSSLLESVPKVLKAMLGDSCWLLLRLLESSWTSHDWTQRPHAK